MTLGFQSRENSGVSHGIFPISGIDRCKIVWINKRLSTEMA
jgi:hypothetical protein